MIGFVDENGNAQIICIRKLGLMYHGSLMLDSNQSVGFFHTLETVSFVVWNLLLFFENFSINISPMAFLFSLHRRLATASRPSDIAQCISELKTIPCPPQAKNLGFLEMSPANIAEIWHHQPARLSCFTIARKNVFCKIWLDFRPKNRGGSY